MTIRTRLDALEHLLDDLNLADMCPSCRAPNRHSPHINIEKATVSTICPKCRRLIDHDGLPIGGHHWMMVVTEPDGSFPLEYARPGLIWSEDGGPVRIDGGKLTIVDRFTADRMF